MVKSQRSSALTLGLTICVDLQCSKLALCALSRLSRSFTRQISLTITCGIIIIVVSNVPCQDFQFSWSLAQND